MADPVQAARVAFNRMREDLVARGLLDQSYRLTSQGHTYVDQLIAEKKAETARRSSDLLASQIRQEPRSAA